VRWGRVPDRAWPLLALITLTAVYGAAYGRFVGRFFAFDDFTWLAITDQIHVSAPSDLLRFFAPWPTFTLYRPLTTLASFWTARALLGLDPARWSVALLGVHIVNALLAYGIARRLLHSRPAGLATALLYACAPGHALAVRWFSFFTITGTVLAYLGGLWIWLSAGPRARMPATLAVFVVGLLCSEHAASFPAAVTAVAVLAQGRRDWRRLLREVGPLWAVAAVYVAAKLLFILVLEPRWDAARASSNRAAGYALVFDPVVTLGTLGRYVSAAVAPLYPLGHSPGWYRAAGACTVVLMIATVAATWLAKPSRPWIGVTACGLVLLVLGLAQVLFLPTHVFPAYVGIAALGASLAIIAPVAALPRGHIAAAGLAAVFVALHLGWTAAAARNEMDFRTVEGLSVLAARWLSAVDHAAGSGTEEVVVPLDRATAALFGVAHRLFLCASYDVHPVPDLRAVPSRPGLVVVEQPAAPLGDDLRGWRTVVRQCPG
jgi:hypothetical protein